MKLKITILGLFISLGAIYSGEVQAQSPTKDRGVLNIGSAERKNKDVPKGINDAKFDNAKKRNKNYKARTDITSGKKKYTETRSPVRIQAFDPKSWGKPTKWVQKRLPKQKKADPGPQEEIAEN